MMNERTLHRTFIALAIIPFVVLDAISPARLRRSVPPAVAAGFALIALIAVPVQWTPVVSRGITAHPDVQALYAELRQHGHETSLRVQSFRPRILTLRTGVPAMAIFRAGRGAMLAELCSQRIDHVILGDLGAFPFETEALHDAIASEPNAFRSEYQNASFNLFAFFPDSASACTQGAAGGPRADAGARR